MLFDWLENCSVSPYFPHVANKYGFGLGGVCETVQKEPGCLYLLCTVCSPESSQDITGGRVCWHIKDHCHTIKGKYVICDREGRVGCLGFKGLGKNTEVCSLSRSGEG